MDNSTMTDWTPVNPIYLAYNAPGLHLGLFGPALFYSLLATIGISLNSSLVYVTLRNRKSKIVGSKTGILLALNSSFEIMHQSSHFIFLAVAISGTNFIPVRLALPIEAYAIFGFICSFSMFTLSLDRLFAVSAPFRYGHVKLWSYLLFHLLSLVPVNLYAFWTFSKAAQLNPDWPVTGLISDVFMVPGQPIYGFYISMGASVGAILVYLLVALILKCKSQAESEQLRKLYRSLCLIVLFNVGGYFIGCMAHHLFLGVLQLSPVQFWHASQISGIFVNVTSFSNAPILYINNVEYRETFRKEFGPLFRMFFPANSLQANAIVVPLFSVKVGSKGIGARRAFELD